MNVVRPVLLAVVLVASPLASAQNAPADVKPLIAKGACLSCHAVDTKVLGPAYKDVAAKYKADAGAADRLAGKIVKGGVGVWGRVPMPPAAGVTPADAKVLANWVLAGAPAR